MKGIVTICARGGSKGIPGKNIKKIAKTPLIHYTLAVAARLQLDLDLDIYLSTDSAEIRQVVDDFGNRNIKTHYSRPPELATDSAGKLGAIIDVMNFAQKENTLEYGYVIDLDVTAPFRTVEDVLNAYNLVYKDSRALNIFSVSPANRNPYFNMVEQKENGYYSLCKQGKFLSRQTAPKVYDMNASFYIYKKEFFDKNLPTAISSNSLVYEVPHICFDLDHPIDFDFLEYLILNNKLDFNLI